MNRGIASIIDALKASPLLLAVLLCNVVVAVGLLYMLREISDATKTDREVRNALLTQCLNNTR
jgi:high-affinity nickel permease